MAGTVELFYLKVGSQSNGCRVVSAQSGEIDRSGAISRCGDEMMRTLLYEAAQSMLFRSTRWSWLKAWAMHIARHRGMKNLGSHDGRCYGAVARILHSIVADVNRWSAPMQKLNDLNRSLAALEPDGTLIAVIEMSLSSWLVAGIVPGIERQPLKKLVVDESALLKLRPMSFTHRV